MAFDQHLSRASRSLNDDVQQEACGCDIIDCNCCCVLSAPFAKPGTKHPSCPHKAPRTSNPRTSSADPFELHLTLSHAHSHALTLSHSRSLMHALTRCLTATHPHCQLAVTLTGPAARVSEWMAGHRRPQLHPAGRACAQHLVERLPHGAPDFPGPRQNCPRQERVAPVSPSSVSPSSISPSSEGDSSTASAETERQGGGRLRSVQLSLITPPLTD